MNKSRIAIPALAALTMLTAPTATLLASHPAPASASPAAPMAPGDDSRESVLVTGKGEVFGQPDMLSANFAVEVAAATVADALARANAAATRMRDTLVKDGVAKADLQTSDVNITSQRNDKEVITGYTVSQGLTAKIRKLPRAGALISAAVKAGGDAARLHGVSFAIEDDTALLAEARKKAFADARGKAALYAGEAGRPLGRVVKVSEGAPRYEWPGDQDRGALALTASDYSVPVEPGRQKLSVTVTVEWAFAKDS